MSDLLAKTREICHIFEIKPARSKGQNFLINEKIYDDIIKAADLKPDDIVLEVGPGLGFLTAKLAAKVKQVVAVELDNKLAEYLQTGIDSQGIENVAIINENILDFNLEAYFKKLDLPLKYKIVANLPYNITSIFLRRFLTSEHKPEALILMLQKEVAERIAAAPPEMSVLALSVQYYAAPKIIREVKAGNFWPEPKVDSAVIRIDLKPQPFDTKADKDFFRIVKIGFSSKRKMLKNNLAAGLRVEPKAIEDTLIKAGIKNAARAEDLFLEDWQKLFAALKPFMV
ncbi:MAG: 16S rRNA (adenine(1518)-N(6)/adenine(1519)-N(6))-dimethyltransferase RsmA [Patescibacteria group bacterium]|jgi:16S rRNA (adenine1518-N6/adenine1519-N6)-dimethyltransferase